MENGQVRRPDQGWYDLFSSNLLVWLHGQDCWWFLKPRYRALPYIMMHYVITLFLAVADGPPSSSDQQNETAPFKLEATVPSRLALGARCGYGQRCWGSPVRQKKKHTGNHFSTNVCIFYTENKLNTVTASYRLYKRSGCDLRFWKVKPIQMCLKPALMFIF